MSAHSRLSLAAFGLLGPVLLAAALCSATPAGAAVEGDGCTAAGLTPPTQMKASFELTDAGPVHRTVTVPRARFRYRFRALPSRCSGEVLQVVEVKVKYKTERLRERTLRVYQSGPYGGTRRKTWLTLYRGSAGTGVFGEEIPPSGYRVEAECEDLGFLTDIGRVQRASATERITVKQVGSGAILARSSRRLPVSFTPKRKHDTAGGHIVCAPAQLPGQG